MKREYILCAAIHFDDGKVYKAQPKGIELGVVMCGRRHHNVFAQLAMLAEVRKTELEIAQEVQGFITNTDRFVDRVEAAEIAYEAGQVEKRTGRLFSEDLY